MTMPQSIRTVSVAAIVTAAWMGSATAAGLPWVEVTDLGLDAAAEFAKASKCSTTAEKISGALAHAGGPILLGSAIGVAVGALSGSARKGIVSGVAAAALARTAGLGDVMRDWASAPSGAAAQRDRNICELIDLGERTKQPIIAHLLSVLDKRCGLSAAVLQKADPNWARVAVVACSAGDESVREAIDAHFAAIRSVNTGTCRAAAFVVYAYNDSGAFATYDASNLCAGTTSVGAAWAPIGQRR